MSVSTATAARDLPPRPGAPARLPTALTAFAAAAIVVSAGLLAVGVWNDRDVIVEAGWALLPWVAMIAAVGLVSVSSDAGSQLSLDLPLGLAAGFLFGPAVGGAMVFIGYMDSRELRGTIPLIRALFNRAQTALSVMAAAAVFGAVSGDVTDWPSAGLAALLALGVDCCVNYAFVVGAKALHEHTSPLQSLLDLRFGRPGPFLLAYVSYGFLSLVLAQVYVGTGVWGLAAFAMPVVLARHAFEQTRRLVQTDYRLQRQSRVLRGVTSRVADERREERLAVAAGLHDDVLPPLFNVHLMGQVLRQDLATGRLLDLENDIPDLLKAVDTANSAVRGLIYGLRASPLGSTGLRGTLALLVDHLQPLSTASFELDMEDLDGPPLTQLLVYEVIREALNNSVRHSAAAKIRVQAGVHEGAVRVVVEDDGKGFTPAKVDEKAHFGLSMMRERVELVGGILHIESAPGAGTRVLVRLPLEIRPRAEQG